MRLRPQQAAAWCHGRCHDGEDWMRTRNGTSEEESCESTFVDGVRKTHGCSYPTMDLLIDVNHLL